MQNLGTLGGDFSYAWSISETSYVTGESNNGDETHAFIWDSVGGMLDLGSLPDTTFSTGLDINSNRQVAGYSGNDFSDYQAVYWSESSQIHDIGTLGGAWSKAYGISESGVVVGESVTSDGYRHAFRWVYPDQLDDLGAMPGNYLSVARDVNDQDQVVGYGNYGGGTRALLWEDGEIHYLRDLVPNYGSWSHLEEAYGINNAGEIVGWGWYNGDAHAFLLSPIGPFEMLPPQPGIAGQMNRFQVENATPFITIYFVYGMQDGSTQIPGCSGVYVEIANPVLFGQGVADVIGTAYIDKMVPGAAAGRTIFLQAVNHAYCETTNLVEFVFE